MAEGPSGFEYKHVECPQVPAWVNVVTNDHAMFYWELTGTQTVVSVESHLESSIFTPDTLYSVTTDERFVTMDFKRATDIPNLPRIKEVEREYFQICVALVNLGSSPVNNYSTPPKKEINWTWLIVLGSFSALIGSVWYYRSKDKKHKEAIAQWTSFRASRDELLQENRAILNFTT